jgi:hypothetical protein
MRWGRILLVLVGVGLIAFGAWTATARTSGGSDEGTGPGTGAKVVSGGGAGDGSLDIASPPKAVAPTSAPKVAAPAARKPAARPAAKQPARRPGARRSAGRRGAVVAGGGFAAASANAAPGAGGGATAPRSGELPMTGLSTWIAAVLGSLLLGLGVCVHVNAVRLGMTALLYRRGILLRPVDCARLAQEHGLPRVRVALSNALHRLLEEPAARGDFVTAHIAR